MEILCNTLKTSECPLCKSNRIVQKRDAMIHYYEPVLFSTTKIQLKYRPEIWSCIRCKSLFIQNILPPETADELYKSGNSNERWTPQILEKMKCREVIKALDKYFTNGSAVCDFGCNTGEVLDYAAKRGCITYGIELSDSSRDILKNKGHNAYKDFSEINAKFDVITAFDLVEHLYDINAFLDKCCSMLRDKGVLIVVTGKSNCLSAKVCGSKWWYLRYPEHIIFPSKKYFNTLDTFKLRNCYSTDRSPDYKLDLLSKIKPILFQIKNGRYEGIPSIGHDQEMYILEKA